MRKLRRSALSVIMSRRNLPSVRASSFITLPGRGTVDRVIAEVGHPQVVEQDAAVGDGIGPHPPLALRGEVGKLGYEPAALVEQLFGLMLRSRPRASSGARGARRLRQGTCGPGMSLPSAGRRRPSARSSPWACSGRSSASAVAGDPACAASAWIAGSLRRPCRASPPSAGASPRGSCPSTK